MLLLTFRIIFLLLVSCTHFGFCQRISAEKCEEYTKILRPSRLFDFLLPKIFKSNQPQPIKCQKQINYIVGGRDATSEEIPYQVALGYGKADAVTWGCGGTLLSDQYVLTAAHCVQTDLGPPQKVLLGDTKLGEEFNLITSNMRTIVGISDTVVHPEYQLPAGYNDIALIKLAKRIAISKAILPACLPQPEDRFEKNTSFIASGWGKILRFEDQSGTLQTVNLTYWDREECNSMVMDGGVNDSKYPQGILKTQICAGDKYGNKDTCTGDSGGPLTAVKDVPCVHYVVGVTQSGNSNCGMSTPGIYVNVVSYLNWIENIVWSPLQTTSATLSERNRNFSSTLLSPDADVRMELDKPDLKSSVAKSKEEKISDEVKEILGV